MEFHIIAIITMNMVQHPLMGITHQITLMEGQMAMEEEVLVQEVLVVEVFMEMVEMVILHAVQV